MSDGVTAAASRFIAEVKLDDVPEAVLLAARHSILDGLGLALAGSRSEAAAIARAEVADYGCSGRAASVLGTDLRLPVRFAAFLNGLAIHADDYDDTQLAVRPDRVYGLLTHPTAPVLPAALAVAEAGGGDGASLLLAYLVGVEVETKFAEAIDPRHYDSGFHSTGTLGTLGAAAAAARGLGLEPEKVAIALGVAASEASGLRESFGTMTKPLHAGRAAENGVLAARLAARGFTAASDIMEARRGFFNAAGGGFDLEAAVSFGSPWTFAMPGVSIKPHPSGSLTHPAMSVLADLLRQKRVEAGEIEWVRVGTNHHMPNALIHHDPRTALNGKFSMEFCMAILCLEGRAGLAQFTDATVMRPDVRRMMARVRFDVDPEAEAAGYNTMTSIVTVRLWDGREYTGSAAFGKGSPQNPMSETEQRRKFLECLEVAGISADAGDRAADLVLNLELQRNLGPLLALIAPAAQVARPAP